MLPRVRRLTLTKGGGCRTEDLFGPSDSGFYYDFSKTDGMFLLANGPTNVSADTDPIGLLMDRKGWGGKTRAAVEAAAAEGIRNPVMLGASPGTPPTHWTLSPATGYTITIEGTGTEDSLPYVDIRFAGTDASARGLTVFFESTTQIAAATAQCWRVSTQCRIVGGSLTGVSVSLRADEYTSAPAYVTGSQFAFTPTSSRQEYFAYYVTAGGATTASVVPLLRVNTGAGATVDLTLRVYVPSMKRISGRAATGSGSARPFFYTAGYGRGDAIDDNLLTTFTPAAVGNTIMARVTVPASLGFTQHVVGALTTAGGRLLLGFTTAGYLVGGSGTVDGSIIRHEVDYRSQTGTIALTEDGSNWYLYWDGVQVDTGAVSGGMTVTPLMLYSLNVSGTPSGPFGGDIYKALAIDRALTPAEILRTHNLWSN